MDRTDPPAHAGLPTLLAQRKRVDIMSTNGQSHVNDAKALAEIQRLARLGRIVYTPHARRRMKERGATELDVRHALRIATAARYQADRRNWRVEGGVDTEGDELMLICDLEADVIVVTLF